MLAGLASQLGRPTGLRGRLIGNVLNRSNRGEIAMAIAALVPAKVTLEREVMPWNGCDRRRLSFGA